MFWTPPPKNISGYGLVPTVLSAVVYPGIPKRKTSGESPPPTHLKRLLCIIHKRYENQNSDHIYDITIVHQHNNITLDFVPILGYSNAKPRCDVRKFNAAVFKEICRCKDTML